MSFWSSVGGNAQRIFDMALAATTVNLAVAGRITEGFAKKALHLDGLNGTKRQHQNAADDHLNAWAKSVRETAGALKNGRCAEAQEFYTEALEQAGMTAAEAKWGKPKDRWEQRLNFTQRASRRVHKRLLRECGKAKRK